MLSERSVVVGEYDNFAEQLNSLSGKKGNSHKHRASTLAPAPSSNRNQVTSFIAPKLITTPLRVETKNLADIMLGNQGGSS
ncbi:hypothetical protein KIN20_025728 [Parelaphostrongylus tenuis]|uniref:Uncharacterized protein n=1 Tax=Parelaphostrongylus tenuis TaxID=148309 RepID=A0AAD5NC22_PARTN|nr:hypothetical protein KIN20_025728 [Parelaphostrongylus tenuis]